MLFETHTTPAAASSGPGLSVCGPPTINSSMRRAVDHRDWGISTVTRAVEDPWSTDEHFDLPPGAPRGEHREARPGEWREQKARPEPRSAGQQRRQEHRGEAPPGHVPAR